MRLTKKRADGHYDDLDECVSTRCSDKLGQLEDIEELCKEVTKQPYYQKYLDGTISKVDDTDCVALYCFEENAIALIYAGEWYGSLRINEYGKTWALTKEELP